MVLETKPAPTVIVKLSLYFTIITPLPPAPEAKLIEPPPEPPPPVVVVPFPPAPPLAALSPPPQIQTDAALEE